MLFKMKMALSTLALTTAMYAVAQEKSGQVGSPQNPASGTQVGKNQSPKSDDSQPGENRNRRRDNSAESNEAQNRPGENRTGEDRNRRDATATTQRTETRERRAGAASDSPLDSQLASCLLIGNQKEVTISQFASERAKNEKVKAFAKQMIKDHTQAITMLQRFAGPDASKDLSSNIESTRANRTETTVNRSSTTVDPNRSQVGERPDATNPANRDSSVNRKSGDANKATDNDSKRSPEATARASSDSDRNNAVTTSTVQVRSEHEAMPDKMLAIQREIAQRCIAMAKQELEQSSNFDQAYVGMQISAHMGMIAHLETYKSYASQDLGKVIQESLDTTQSHLRHAKELVMEISHDKTGSRGSATSSSDTSNRNEASGREANARNPANRDDSSSRREGGIKKDAPKS